MGKPGAANPPPKYWAGAGAAAASPPTPPRNATIESRPTRNMGASLAVRAAGFGPEPPPGGWMGGCPTPILIFFRGRWGKLPGRDQFLPRPRRLLALGLRRVRLEGDGLPLRRQADEVPRG